MKTVQSLLNQIDGPADLRKLDAPQLAQLARELRERIIRVVAARGGHLGANLGVVELTLALLRSFQPPGDRIVWDVGHQSYSFKLLTGRREFFESLREFGGCCGFPVRGESPFDCYGAGHAGVAISAALGMCSAEPPDSRRKIIAVVGDGALGSGIALEGLNQAREHGRNLVIILNDNKMAIAPNVGAIASCLNRVIVGRRYRYIKNLAKTIVRALPRSETITRHVSRIEEAAKNLLLPGGIFEELGIRYLGPINGHSIADMERTFAAIRGDDRPVLVHIVTEKGRGYAPAVASPERFHGVSRFAPESGEPLDAHEPGFSAAFGAAMTDLAGGDERICAVVAAMGGGVGLNEFKRRFEHRLYDVGIAESHAVSFASGLAAAGRKPVVAVYATFMQRGLDHIFHDVCLMNLPVVFALDRAGVVEDGPTHHGIYDLGFLLAMPNLTVLAPADEAEVAPMLAYALNLNAPAVLRYPRGASGAIRRADCPGPAPLESGRAAVWRAGSDLAIYAAGAETVRALGVADVLKARYGLDAKIVNVRFLKPFDAESLRRDLAVMPVFTLEDHVAATGLGAVAAVTAQQPAAIPNARLSSFGYPSDQTVPFGAVNTLRRKFELDTESLARRIAAALETPEKI